jgi:hypothetical protein
MIGAKAQIPNPALAPLAFLIGEWRTTGTHPMLPGKQLPGRTRFAWAEGGAFLIMHSQVDAPDFPDGVAIFGSDDSAGSVTMLWFDQRETSRRYEVELGDNSLTWHRDDPELAQTNTLTAEGDGLVSKGRMSQQRGPWTDDLSQTFERVR